MPMPDGGDDPGLIAAWLTARSIARGVPAPVPDHGGLRVDSNQPDESVRFVFARPSPGLTELGRTIDDPRAVLKLCAGPETMRALLPDRWHLHAAGTVMLCDAPMRPASTPDGYRLCMRRETSGAIACVALTDAGEAAARGWAVEHGGVFIFDRIMTEAAHQRRGLGSALVAALAAERRHAASRFVLVATDEGRALYERLGWRAHLPYTTARLAS